MLNNRPSIAILIASLVLVNLIMANLYFDTLSGPIQDYRDDKELAALNVINDNVDQAFAGSNKSEWEDIAYQLESEFGYTVDIYLSKNLTPASLDQQSGSEQSDSYILNQDWLDIEHSYITYALDGSYIAEVSPSGASASGLDYFVEWFAWITCALVNITLLGVFLWRASNAQRNLTVQVESLLDASASLTDQESQTELADQADTHKKITLLKQALEHIKQRNDERLVMQRDLLHGVAHEFRSPMARLQFALDMLEDASQQERPQLQRTMLKSLADLDELVKELLYYARLEDIQASYKLEAISLQELEQIGQLACEKVQSFYPNIDFTVENRCEAANDKFVLVERKLMLRLLNNLCRNAGRFAHQTCLVSLSISSNRLHICVDDDGIGIPPGKAQRIFEPFTRLDGSRSRDSGGCGLGLAIVASIVKRHNGEITVKQSDLGGAKFVFSLPL